MPTWVTSAARRSPEPGCSSSCRRWLLNYLGQGALLIGDAKAMRAPFFLLIPGWATMADGAIGHRRNDNRVAGGDHRRIFAGIAGRPARLPSEAAR